MDWDVGGEVKWHLGGFFLEEVESGGVVGGHVGSPVLLDKRSNAGCA